MAESANVDAYAGSNMGAIESSKSSSGLLLWGVGTSRTIRAHWALAELGLDYQTRAILPRTGETLTEEYTALTPRQKIPLLQDQGLVITESAAIMSYLSDAYGQEHNRLIPTDTAGRAKCMEWCFFAISELDATSLYVLRRHRDLKDVYGESPVANDAACAYFHKQMRAVDHALADQRPYLLGERFGAADIILTSCIAWAIRYGLPVSDLVKAYHDRVTGRPTYQLALQRNQVRDAFKA